MKTLKRIWANLKWLCNHPPISLRTDRSLVCDYCESGSGNWRYEGDFANVTICSKCRKKVYDAILKEVQNE